jgi:hypothetical protein
MGRADAWERELEGKGRDFASAKLKIVFSAWMM